MLRLVQLLEGINEFSLPMNFQSRYKDCYNHTLYGGWPSSLPMPDVGTKLSFCGNGFMISKSNINDASIGLFILSHVLIPPKQSIALMPFYILIYCQIDYLNIVKYKHNISMYSMHMNGYVSGNFNRRNLLYINGHPHTWKYFRVHK